MTEPTNTEAPATETVETVEISEQLGDAGKKAIDAMKAERNAAQAELRELKKQVKELQGRDPVKAIADALGVKPSTEPDAVTKLTEQVAEMRRQQQSAELRALRAEVAAEKKLPPALAARLQGATREELAADAETLAALIPQAGTPGTPAPDPSQGPRGGAPDLHAAIAAAREKGDVMESIRLQGRLLDNARAKQQ